MPVTVDTIKVLASLRQRVQGRFGLEGGLVGFIEAVRGGGGLPWLQARGVPRGVIVAALAQASVPEMIQAAADVRTRARERFADDVRDVDVGSITGFVTMTARNDDTEFAHYAYTVDELMADDPVIVE